MKVSPPQCPPNENRRTATGSATLPISASNYFFLLKQNSCSVMCIRDTKARGRSITVSLLTVRYSTRRYRRKKTVRTPSVRCMTVVTETRRPSVRTGSISATSATQSSRRSVNELRYRCIRKVKIYYLQFSLVLSVPRFSVLLGFTARSQLFFVFTPPTTVG